MTTCVYTECRQEVREVDESKWHVETKIGVMHVMCNTQYEASLCGKCGKFVDGSKGGNAVMHKDKPYHQSCLRDMWTNLHVQLALNFKEV